MNASNGGRDGGFDLSRIDERDLPQALLVALGAAVVLALVFFTSTSTTAFEPFNPSWEGTSDLRGDVEDDPDVTGEFVVDQGRYGTVDPEETVAFVVTDDDREGPDGDRIGAFVRAGGTLVVFENFDDAGNELLADVGAEARTDGRVLRDEHNYYRGPTMPVAADVGNDSLTDGVEQLTLNHGTAVEPGNATVLVSTSEFAYLVEDPEEGPEAVEDDSAIGPHPVATVEELGEGRVVVVGDPSITINAMREEPDNAAFLEHLYADEERILFDVTEPDEVPPLAAALLTVRETPLLQTLLGALAVAGLAGLGTWRVRPGLERVLRRRSRRRRGSERSGRAAHEPTPGLSEAERVAFLRRRYPDWEDERVERVTTAIDRVEGEGGEPSDDR